MKGDLLFFISAVINLLVSTINAISVFQEKKNKKQKEPLPEDKGSRKEK